MAYRRQKKIEMDPNLLYIDLPDSQSCQEYNNLDALQPLTSSYLLFSTDFLRRSFLSQFKKEHHQRFNMIQSYALLYFQKIFKKYMTYNASIH